MSVIYRGLPVGCRWLVGEGWHVSGDGRPELTGWPRSRWSPHAHPCHWFAAIDFTDAAAATARIAAEFD